MVTVAAARGRDGRQALNVHQCVPCQPEPVQFRVYRKCGFPRWVAARDSGKERESHGHRGRRPGP